MPLRPKVTLSRSAFVVVSIAVSLAVGCFAGEPLRLSEKPSEYIGLLFSMLAAAIFAVVSIIGDPSMLLPGNRRLAWESAVSIQTDIQRLNVVFFFQLLTLFLLVVTELVEFMKYERFYWTFNFLGGLSSFSFIMSLSLPFELGKLQRERLNAEIKSRKNS
ncbi:MAG: hypothetical protein HQ479_04400 [Rhodobacter sp.]|jgi:hypothetical protein|nr:hypothetical protein [Rhodobacter sp.]